MAPFYLSEKITSLFALLSPDVFVFEESAWLLLEVPVKNFLKMHEGGVACVSIQHMPYDYDKNGYAKTYFEEENQENILDSEIFKSISNEQVDHFNIIGGGMYKVELCIYLKEN